MYYFRRSLRLHRLRGTFLHPVKFKAETDAPCALQRIVELGRNEVRTVDVDDAVLHAKARSKKLTGAFGFRLVKITGPYAENIIIPVFHTGGNVDLLQLFLKAARGISKRLQ